MRSAPVSLLLLLAVGCGGAPFTSEDPTAAPQPSASASADPPDQVVQVSPVGDSGTPPAPPAADAGPACDSKTCSGCCDAVGVCHTGSALGPQACGTGGGKCDDCTAGWTSAGPNAECIGWVCTLPKVASDPPPEPDAAPAPTPDAGTAVPPVCDAQSCQGGCCDNQGVCWATSNATCGYNGAACVNCGAGTCGLFGKCV